MDVRRGPPLSTTALYHSPIGLFDFQADHIARAYVMRDALVAWSTGLGKTHLGMALASLLFEDDEIDLAIYVVEANKVDEWVADLARFTRLDPLKYHGAVAKRERMRTRDIHEVTYPALVTTYETLKADAAVFGDNPRKHPTPGIFLEAVAERRTLVVLDEATKIKNRSSNNHRAMRLVLKHLRKSGSRVMAMSATPVEKNIEDAYNILRLVAPGVMPTVAEFEERYVAYRDEYDRPRFQNVASTPVDEMMSVVPFQTLVRPHLLRKRKTDPDVIEQFPKQVEEITTVKMPKRHLDLIATVEDTFYAQLGDEEDERSLYHTARMLAAWPEALVNAKGKFARQVVEEVGVEGLRAFGSPKADALVDWLRVPVEVQEAQALVFTFYGQAVLPLIEARLASEGWTTATYHGGMTRGEKERQKQRFKDGEAQILLLSDAGARGINLPEATYVAQFEPPTTHAIYEQRMNRNHRIDSDKPSVTSMLMVALDTIDEGLANLMLSRNAASDVVLGDGEADGAFVSAHDRRRLMAASKRKVA